MTRTLPLAVLILAIFCAGCRDSRMPASVSLKDELNVDCWVKEYEMPAGPYTNGSLEWTVNLDLANTSSKNLQFGDDMILMDGNSEQAYCGAYVVYNRTGSSGGDWGIDYNDRAHNYAISNFYEYWPDGSMLGYSDGGSYHKGTPPEFKAAKSACNTLLAPGEKVSYSVPMNQGVWLRRDLSTRLLLVLPEIQTATKAPVSSGYRMILTLKRSATTKDQWDLQDIRVVPLQTIELKQLLASSQKDTAMRILAVNWLTAVDKAAASPFILEALKHPKTGLDFVASVQLLGYHKIHVDPESWRAIEALAAGEESWSKKAAARYLKANAVPAPTVAK